MMYAVLDFESKNLIAENKKPCLPRVVDFSKFSQVIIYFFFPPFIAMIFELLFSQLYFDTLIFSHRAQVLRQALFLRIFFAQKWIVCWIKLLKTLLVKLRLL